MRIHRIVMASVTLALVAVAPAMADVPEPGPRCGWMEATIIGTPGDDVLVGTPGDDAILGRGGDDVIIGLGGDDALCGGKGKDVLRGGDGRDHLEDGRGADRLRGGRGDDWLYPGRGDDLVTGGPGRDSVNYQGARRGVTVDLRAGLASGWGRDEITSVLDITGSHLGDVLLGDEDRNVIYGDSDSPTAMRQGRAGDATEADVIRGRGGDDLLISIGSDPGNRLYGGPGDDVIKGQVLGGEWLYGGAGNDRLEATLGDDHLYGGPGNDRLLGSWGDDHLFGGLGNDRLEAGRGDDHNDGGQGYDHCTGDPSPIACEAP